MNAFTKLLYSRKFWLAVLALIQTALFIFRPQFPLELWNAITEVLLVLIISITVEDVGTIIAAGIDSSFGDIAAALTEDMRLPWLLSSRKFWLAVIALVQTVIFSTMPDFPPELWDSINNVLMVVIGLFAVEDAVRSISSAKRNRDLRG